MARGVDTNHYQVVLIDKNNYHTFQPLLYQVASAGLEPDSIAYPIRKTLRRKKNTFFRWANVESIDTESKKLYTNIGEVSYTYLVIATGATNNFFGNKIIENNALPMKSLTDALDLRSKILGNFEQALNASTEEEQEALMNFVIVGAGPTGVELAGSLAELKNKILPKDFPDLDLSKMQINLIEAAPRVLVNMDEKSSEKALKYLKDLGVKVWLETMVENYEDNVVSTKGNSSFSADTFIWAAGVAGTFPNGISTESVGRGKRIITDDYGRMKADNSIYALGDVGLIQSTRYPNGLPMLGGVAMQQGKYLAESFNRLAKGKAPKPFVYNDKGTMATIGRNQSVVELGKLKFQGFFAWLVWMFVHLMLLVGFRNRVVVFINWAWNYVNFNNGLRLIVRPYKKTKL